MSLTNQLLLKVFIIWIRQRNPCVGWKNKKSRFLNRVVKGVVDKILGPVDSFNGHNRTQRGRLPQKTSQTIFFVAVDQTEKYYVHVLNFCQTWFS